MAGEVFFVRFRDRGSRDRFVSAVHAYPDLGRIEIKGIGKFLPDVIVDGVTAVEMPRLRELAGPDANFFEDLQFAP